MPPNLIELTHLQQKSPGECLAVCVEMMLSHIGTPISTWRLLRLLKIRPRFGTPFYNIRNLRRAGITVLYHEKATFAEIQAHIDKGNPCIVPVQANEFPYWPDEVVQHAVVVVGYDEKLVWIHDPFAAQSPIAVPFGDFDLAWFGMNERLAVILAK